MTNAPEDFDLAHELAATADWDGEDARDPDPADWDGEDARDPARADTTGDLDLAERHALRRVAGLSTELEDVTEVEYRQLRLERVVLVGVWTQGESLEDAENSMTELALLAETARSTGPA